MATYLLRNTKTGQEIIKNFKTDLECETWIFKKLTSIQKWEYLQKMPMYYVFHFDVAIDRFHSPRSAEERKDSLLRKGNKHITVKRFYDFNHKIRRENKDLLKIALVEIKYKKLNFAQMKASIECLYLDYWMDFLTIGRFAEYYNIPERKAEKIISLGRQLYNEI